jgi:hypothetical protein
MTFKKIALSAGLLALQAALLALLNASDARAETVYRCEGRYQQQPCAWGEQQHELRAEDKRSAAQVKHASEWSRRYQRATRHVGSGHRQVRQTRGAVTPGLGSLSSHRAGDAPFRNGQQLGIGSNLHRTDCEIRPRRNTCREPRPHSSR